MKAAEWAAIVEGLAAKRGVTYEPVGGLNPKGGPPTLCPGGTNRINGQLASEFWGASCDADEREEGGLFSKTVLPRGDPGEGAHARPRPGRADLQRRVGRGRRAGRAARQPAQGRVRVDRLQQALPGHGARRPRPDRAARAVQPRASSTGRRRSATRSSSGSPTASSTSTGGSASSPRTSTATPSTTPPGCSSACATRWRSTACTRTSPAPGTPAWSRFPTASRNAALATRRPRQTVWAPATEGSIVELKDAYPIVVTDRLAETRGLLHPAVRLRPDL